MYIHCKMLPLVYKKRLALCTLRGEESMKIRRYSYGADKYKHPYGCSFFFCMLLRKMIKKGRKVPK